MFDRRLRETKERLLEPVAARSARRVSATTFTITGFVLCVGAGVAAWQGMVVVSVASWLIGRTFDGLDGAVARHRGAASDLGGYSDLLLDSIGYAVVPIGLAAGADDRTTWIVTAVLLATFYINSVSWLMLSALLEKRAHGTERSGEQTSVTMPVGLIEGTETIVIFTIALAVPSIAAWCFAAMALGVAASVVQRAIAARSLLAVAGPGRWSSSIR